MQIAEWMGHSAVTLLTHYAHLIADGADRWTLPSEQAIRAAREGQPSYTASNSTAGNAHCLVTRWSVS
jgi:hypothetical protein